MTENIPIITLDGPGGSGKGTIGHRLAKALGWHFLDSGAIFRVLAFSVLKNNIDLQNENAIQNIAFNLNVKFNQDIFLDGDNITQEIRTERCGNTASKIAAFPKVREALVERLRAFCRPPGLVADGRDMGTVIFPFAQLKIFLDASSEERARRRFLQLKETVHNVNLQTLLQEIEERDARDKQRATAPLKPAEDAVVIDTTGMGIEAVFDRVMTEVNQCFFSD